MVRPCEYSSLYIIWQANEPYFTGILQQGVYKGQIPYAQVKAQTQKKRRTAL